MIGDWVIERKQDRFGSLTFDQVITCRTTRPSARAELRSIKGLTRDNSGVILRAFTVSKFVVFYPLVQTRYPPSFELCSPFYKPGFHPFTSRPSFNRVLSIWHFTLYSLPTQMGTNVPVVFMGQGGRRATTFTVGALKYQVGPVQPQPSRFALYRTLLDLGFRIFYYLAYYRIQLVLMF